MRISDWSSDVCSSDLLAPDDGVISARSATVGAVLPAGQELFRLIRRGRLEWHAEVAASDLAKLKSGQIAHVTDRKSVVWGKSVSVSVAAGGRRINKTKSKQYHHHTAT